MVFHELMWTLPGCPVVVGDPHAQHLQDTRQGDSGHQGVIVRKAFR
jgi:hypothetical protein